MQSPHSSEPPALEMSLEITKSGSESLTEPSQTSNFNEIDVIEGGDINDVILPCVLGIVLIIIFILSVLINVSILLVFARKQTLRTTSNRFLINMLIVNILSSTLYLPLVLLSLFFVTSDDGLVTSDAGLVQGLLFKFISQFIGALSVLSTLCTGIDQYIGVCHPLHYHRHMTRLRSNYSLGTAWSLSLLVSILQSLDPDLVTTDGDQAPDVVAVTVCLASVTIVHTVPVLLLSVIYTKIFTAAHNSSERARRNSAVSIAPSDSVTPLNLSSSDMRRLAKMAKANQISLTCAAKPPTGLQRQVSGASSTKSEPILQRQGSLMSHLGSSMRRRMSSAGGVMAREEGRAARVYTISLLLLLLTWTPFYTAHCVQVLGHAPLISPVVTVSATLYAPLSALLHGYRNTKVKRELCQMLGLTSAASEDVATPLPSRKMFRSLSMREGTRVGRLRRERLGHRHSFMGPTGLAQTPGPASGDCQESHTLLLALASSSAESSARSSFSGAGGHPRYVTVLAGRQEATC